MISFSVASLCATVLCAGAAAFAWTGLTRWPETWRRLPRSRFAGTLLGLVCLAWSALYVLPMLEGTLVRYQPLIKLMVPVGAMLGCFFLNFLLARAIGGFLILGSAYLINAGFVAAIPARPLFSSVCYLTAIGGMIFVAAPWSMREILAKATEVKRWRAVLTLSLAALALFFAVFAIIA
jgi:hypothetical protein